MVKCFDLVVTWSPRYCVNPLGPLSFDGEVVADFAVGHAVVVGLLLQQLPRRLLVGSVGQLQRLVVVAAVEPAELVVAEGVRLDCVLAGFS